jgi:hypothetical protein
VREENSTTGVAAPSRNTSVNRGGQRANRRWPLLFGGDSEAGAGSICVGRVIGSTSYRAEAKFLGAFIVGVVFPKAKISPMACVVDIDVSDGAVDGNICFLFFPGGRFRVGSYCQRLGIVQETGGYYFVEVSRRQHSPNINFTQTLSLRNTFKIGFILGGRNFNCQS